MPELTNLAIAAAMDELGDLYELDGADQYRVIAYRNAARSIRDASVSVAELVRAGRATELTGVGKTLDEKLRALVETGDIPAAVKLRERVPLGLIAVKNLPGFGPRRARRLFDELGVDSLESLRAAAERGEIRKLRGFGAKVETALLAALAGGFDGTPEPRILLPKALGLGEQVVAALRAMTPHPPDRVELAGSARRMADSVKDLDVIATAADPAALVRALSELPIISEAGRPGDNALRATTHTGMKIDVRVVEPDQFGNVLQHFTGSKDHNVALREAAVRKGLHVSEYGILDDATGETYRCATEEEVYERLGYRWIPPELREGRGELEAAANGTLPERLVEVGDLRGDLHCHTTLSDGRNTLEEMARAAMARGYEYLAVTDHSATHGFGNHVTEDQLRERIAAVRELDARLGDGFHLLAGTETNILPDGAPDYPDELLAELDWVMASVHTSFGMPEKEMTARMVAAMEHPYIDCIGHPTGRKIETRQPYAVDVGALIEAAVRTGTMLEINSASDRRDLNDVHARAAAQAGVRLLINSDAHGVTTFGTVEWGVATARRAWLTPEQVANTLPWAQFGPLRKRARA